MIHNEKFTISSSKLDRDYTICSLADIHNNKWATFELWDKLIEEVDKTSPDIILVSGDLTYTADDFYVPKNDRMLRYLFCNLDSIAETFICLGNHELKCGKKYIDHDSIEYLKRLDKLTGVHILDRRVGEEYIDIGNMRIGGFCPRSMAYYKSKESMWEEYFIEDYMKSLLEFTDKQFNILLTHSPDTISKKEVLTILRNKLKELDLIVCGHKHDGYMPKIIQGILDDTGIDVSDGKRVTDYIVTKTDKCRGEFDVLNAKMIVNRGYRKFSHTSPIFGMLDKIFPRDMATITLKKKL